MTIEVVHKPEQMSGSYDIVIINVDPKHEVDRIDDIVGIVDKLHIDGKQRVAWVSFAGYDEDPREVWDIPECTDWTRSFLERFFAEGLFAEKVKCLRVLGDDRRGPGPGIGLPNLLLVAGLGKATQKENKVYDIELEERAHIFLDFVYGLDA